MTTKGVLISAIVVGIAVVLISPIFRLGGTIDRKSREKNAVTQLTVALRAYKSEYGEYPSGEHSTILRALIGDNPKKIAFYEPNPKDMNSQGELIDRWGTPYRIDLSDRDTPHVSSAGNNKIFETEAKTSDDIFSWK